MPAWPTLIKAKVRDVADYPKPGVVFKDITPLLADGQALAAVVSALAGGHGPVDKVAGIEARGFILAASAACQLGSGFVPVRKQGRLPGPTYAQSYQLEYGTATIEVHQDAFTPGERVLIVDDVLATGRHGRGDRGPGAPRRGGDRRHRRHPGTVVPRRPGRLAGRTCGPCSSFDLLSAGRAGFQRARRVCAEALRHPRGASDRRAGAYTG